MANVQQKFDIKPVRPQLSKWLDTTNDITSVFLSAGRIPGLINLGGGLPDAQTFPVERMAEIAKEAVLAHPGDCLGYGPIAGLPELRDCIAARFSQGSTRLDRDNVFITSGGMQGLELLGKILLDNGSVIAAQFPTYLGALDAWRPRSPEYRNMRLDQSDFDATSSLLDAQFAYTVPNFSNPTGKMVGEEQRRELVRAAEATGTWLIEDDPYGTLQYDGEPLPRMLDICAQDRNENPYNGPVIYMGTMSKQIAPGLRIGWLIAAPEIVRALTAAKQGSDMCTSGLTQRIALAAIEEGLIEAIQPSMVELYRERRDVLCAALEREASQWLTFEKPVGGMFVWATLKDPAIDTDQLLGECLKAGVCVSPSSVFDAFGRNNRSVRLNFTLNPPDKLEEAVLRIASALRALSGQTHA